MSARSSRARTVSWARPSCARCSPMVSPCARSCAGSDRRNLLGLDVEVAEGDLTDPSSLRRRRGLRGGVPCRGRLSPLGRRSAADVRANVDGSVNVLEAAAAAGAARMVYTSSVAVLGINRDRTPADEDTPVTVEDMVGHYKRSKFLAEQAVRRRAQELGFPVVTVNPSTPIGPRDIKPTPTGRILLDAAAGRMPAFVDTGLEPRARRRRGAGPSRGAEAWGRRASATSWAATTSRCSRSSARRRARRPPSEYDSPAALVGYPLAVAAEGVAMLTKREPRVTLDGVRMSTKHMYFSSRKAQRQLQLPMARSASRDRRSRRLVQEQ